MNNPALDRLKTEYINEYDLASFLAVDATRLRDLRSKGTGFIPYYKPTAKCTLYKVEDVLVWIAGSVKNAGILSYLAALYYLLIFRIADTPLGLPGLTDYCICSSL